MIPFGTTLGDRWSAAAAAASCIVESECEETAGGKHRNKTQFLCFSFLWLPRNTRVATLLSSLGVINEHVLHGGREEWWNCYLYFGIISFCMPLAYPLPPTPHRLEAYWIARLLITETWGLPKQWASWTKIGQRNRAVLKLAKFFFQNKKWQSKSCRWNLDCKHQRPMKKETALCSLVVFCWSDIKSLPVPQCLLSVETIPITVRTLMYIPSAPPPHWGDSVMVVHQRFFGLPDEPTDYTSTGPEE